MNSNLFNITMQKGLILGLIFSLNFIFGISGVGALAMLNLPIIILIFYLIYKFGVDYRNKELDGSISFGHAFKYVFLVIIFGNIILAAAKFVYFQFINPDILADTMNETLTMLDELMPISDEMYEATEVMAVPINNVLLGLFGNVFIALIGALIYAGILKKDRNPFANSEIEQI